MFRLRDMWLARSGNPGLVMVLVVRHQTTTKEPRHVHLHWPLNLYQGDFRPEPRDETELLECDLGAIEIPSNLPDNARTELLEVSGC